MQLLNQKISIRSFFESLAKTKSSILMLDYDGTLSPFTPDRDNAVPYEGIPKRLEELFKLKNTRVIVVSGRDIKMLRRLLNMESYPELYGSHGAEYFSEESGYQLLVSDDVKSLLDEIQKWVDKNSYESIAEFKPVSRAFHWRGKNESEKEHIQNKIKNKWVEKVKSHGMEMHSFNGGVEFRLKSVNKGKAVQKILTDVNLDHTMIAYLGDDLTDEDAFSVIGENGLKVLVRKEIRETKADICIFPPEELYEFIDNWILKCKK